MVMVLYVLLVIMGLAILTDVARLMTAQRLRAGEADRHHAPGAGRNSARAQAGRGG
jgi:hypothetical protein